MTVHELVTELLECDKPDSEVRVTVAGQLWPIKEVFFDDRDGPVKIEVERRAEAHE